MLWTDHEGLDMSSDVGTVSEHGKGAFALRDTLELYVCIDGGDDLVVYGT